MIKEKKMKKIIMITAFITVGILSGCASQPVTTFQVFHANDFNTLVSSGQFQQKTDNFFVINDSSSSMDKEYEGSGYPGQPAPTKFAVEKEILNRINQTMPDDLRLTSSIRSFGFGPCLSWEFSKLNLPPTNYSKSVFGQGIDSLTCASGGSPMGAAINEMAKDLSATSGNIAVLMLSDGHDLSDQPVTAFQSLKQQYGDRLCVYTVWVGNKDEEQGQNELAKFWNTTRCGYGVTADSIANPDDMGKFVRSIFLRAGAPVAVDGDDDGDGVPNSQDQCPGTPKGAHVNKFGCWIIEGVKFDFNKSNIKPEYYGELDKVATVLNNNPGLTVEIQGHTDSKGTVEYNQKLSERRAQSVKKYLDRAITTDVRLSAQGYGLTRPIDTNETEEGRANNRRVQLEVIK
jgi:OOP family OmpA-OmpF porin